MKTGRMEAFSDGVMAILITIMVLGLRDPKGDTWNDLRQALPTVLIYLLSFTFIGIYWNNHHHMVSATERVNGMVLWANLHLLFWLSLVPWTTSWLGSSHFTRVPTAVYGICLLACAVAYALLQAAIVRLQGKGSMLAVAVGGDWKGKVSPALYAVGIGLALVSLPAAAIVLYTVVAVIWFIPDRRVESRLAARTPDRPSLLALGRFPHRRARTTDSVPRPGVASWPGAQFAGRDVA